MYVLRNVFISLIWLLLQIPNLCYAQIEVYLPGTTTACGKAEIFTRMGTKLLPPNIPPNDSNGEALVVVGSDDRDMPGFGSIVDVENSFITTSIGQHKCRATIGKIVVDGNTGHYWFQITKGELLLPDSCFGDKPYFSLKKLWTVDSSSKMVKEQIIYNNEDPNTEPLLTRSFYHVEPSPEVGTILVSVDPNNNECIDIVPSFSQGKFVLYLTLGMPGAKFHGGETGGVSLGNLGKCENIKKCTIELDKNRQKLLYQLNAKSGA